MPVFDPNDTPDFDKPGFTEEVGFAISEVREAARLSQKDLAAAIGVSDKTISHLERGSLERVDYMRITEIAKACAGHGWLNADAANIRDYILGQELFMPLRMDRERSYLNWKQRQSVAKKGKVQELLAQEELEERLESPKTSPARGGSFNETAASGRGKTPPPGRGSSTQMSYFGHVRSPRRRVDATGPNDHRQSARPITRAVV